MGFSLYELTENYSQLLNMIDDEEERLRFKDTLEALEDSIDLKVENISKVLRTMEYEIETLKKEKYRIQNRITNREKSIEQLKSYLMECLKKEGLEKMKTTFATVWSQNNPPSISVENVDLIPEKYFVEQEKKIDKKKILEDLKSGHEIMGVSIKQEKGIRIR